MHHSGQAGTERRRYARSSPLECFFVSVKWGETFMLGRLVDIGLGGLSLECLSDSGGLDLSALQTTACDLGIFLSERQLYLTQIRVSCVYSFEPASTMTSFPSSGFTRCGLRFEDLDADQERTLEDFVRASACRSPD